MQIRSLVWLLALVTVLVACGKKDDGGGGGGAPAPNPYYTGTYDPNMPGGQWLTNDLGQPTYLPPNQAPSGFHTPIPGCSQVQAPIFEDQERYCHWLGNREVWNECGFEVRRQVFERDCRAYSRVHGECFRERRRVELSDADIEQIVERERRISDDRLDRTVRRIDENLDQLADWPHHAPVAERPVAGPTPAPAPARPAPPAPVAPVAPALAPARPVVETTPEVAPLSPPPVAAPTAPPATRPPAQPLKLEQCFSLEELQNRIINEKLDSIAKVGILSDVAEKISKTQSEKGFEPGGANIGDPDLESYLRSAMAPFGSLQREGPNKRTFSGGGGPGNAAEKRRGTESALARSVSQIPNQPSITLVNSNPVGTSTGVVLHGKIEKCVDRTMMEILFRQFEPADPQFLPFRATLSLSANKLNILMEGIYKSQKEGSKGEVKRWQALRVVRWSRGSTGAQNLEALIDEDLKNAGYQSPIPKSVKNP